MDTGVAELFERMKAAKQRNCKFKEEHIRKLLKKQLADQYMEKIFIFIRQVFRRKFVISRSTTEKKKEESKAATLSDLNGKSKVNYE